MHNSSAGRQRLQQLVELVDSVLGLDLHMSDEPGALSLAALSAPSFLEMLNRTELVLEKLHHVYEPGEPATNASPTAAAEEVDNLIHICCGEIGPCRQRLTTAMAEGDPLRTVATCGEARSRLAGALLHIEAAVAACEGLEAPARVLWDLEISLQTRSRYAQLRHELNLSQQPDYAELPERLTTFISRFTELQASSVYRFIRFEDRIQMTTLLRRIRTWLDSPGLRAVTTGRQLWEEVGNLIELLRLVNNRQELREHDLRLLDWACRELLPRGSTPQVVSATLRRELENLLGLDAELDELLLDGADHALNEWESCLLRLS